MSAALIAACVAFPVLAGLAGVLLGDSLGRQAAREIWAPLEEGLDDLGRDLRLRRLRGDDR